MASNNVPCLRGSSGWHCEYDKSGGAHCTDYDHFVLVQNEDNDKQGKGSQKALAKVIFPKLFEFLHNWRLQFNMMQNHRNILCFHFANLPQLGASPNCIGTEQNVAALICSSPHVTYKKQRGMRMLSTPKSTHSLAKLMESFQATD